MPAHLRDGLCRIGLPDTSNLRDDDQRTLSDVSDRVLTWLCLLALRRLDMMRSLVWLLIGFALASCASSGPRERDEAALTRYRAHAGEPVSSFHLRLMREWASLGRTHLAVYTGVNEAWLIEVEQPCQGLDFARAVQLSSSGSRVYAKFDTVRFDEQVCRIREIRPVDVRAMKAEQRAAAKG